MDYTLIFYYFVGVFQDFLLTLNWRYIAKEKVAPAAILSFVTTVITFIVLYNILTQMEAERSIPVIIVYALGVGTGTILGMKVKVKP